MKHRISCITLGVDDLEKSLAFYRDGLGLETKGIFGQEFEDGAVVFFDSGYVWEPNQGVDFRRLATSAGIGLRVDALRGAGEALFRLDIGFPMTDGGSGTHGPGVTIGTGQAFTPFVGPFDLQSTTGP